MLCGEDEEEDEEASVGAREAIVEIQGKEDAVVS